MQDELLNGEIALSPGSNRRHQDICHQLHRLLEARVRPGFVVRGDTTINLAGWSGKDYQEWGLGTLVELPAGISIHKSASISVSEIFAGIVQK